MTALAVIRSIRRRRAINKLHGVGVRKVLRRPPVMVEPRHIERDYFHDIDSRLKRVFAYVDLHILQGLPRLIASGQRDLGLRRDAFDDEFQAILAGLRVEFGQQLSEDELTRIARARAFQVSEFNKTQNNKVIKAVLDVDVFRSEPWVEAHATAFARENVRLIKTIESDLLKDFETTILRGVRQGTPAKDIGDSIRERLGVSESRAQLIAVDQIGKLNGQLTRLRQTEIGVTRYVGRTSRDERVRDEHAEREGETFDWDSPPADGHPGQAVRCRCYAEPVIQDLVDEEQDDDSE